MEALLRLLLIGVIAVMTFMGFTTLNHEPVAGAVDYRGNAWIYFVAAVLALAGLIWSFLPQTDRQREKRVADEAMRRQRFEMVEEGRARARAIQQERIARHRRSIRDAQRDEPPSGG